MQTSKRIPNDIVRYFHLTLQAKTLFTLSVYSQQHVTIMRDERMQRCMQKHHETRLVESVPGNSAWMNEEYTLPSGLAIRHMSYKLDKDIIRSIWRHRLEAPSIHEAWYGKGAPSASCQTMQGTLIGISFAAEKTRYPRDRRVTTMRLDLHEEGKCIASVYIADDTREAYDLAYRRIKAVQALHE